MKKFILGAILCVAFSTNAFPASLIVNSELIDKEPAIIDNRVFVPVRDVFEKLGYEVNYDVNFKTASLKKGSTTVVMTNGESFFTVNNQIITPDVPQQIISGSFMLPLRAVGEAINAEVGWDNETKTASINISEESTGLILNDGVNLIEF